MQFVDDNQVVGIIPNESLYVSLISVLKHFMINDNIPGNAISSPFGLPIARLGDDFRVRERIQNIITPGINGCVRTSDDGQPRSDHTACQNRGEGFSCAGATDI